MRSSRGVVGNKSSRVRERSRSERSRERMSNPKWIRYSGTCRMEVPENGQRDRGLRCVLVFFGVGASACLSRCVALRVSKHTKAYSMLASLFLVRPGRISVYPPEPWCFFACALASSSSHTITVVFFIRSYGTLMAFFRCILSRFCVYCVVCVRYGVPCMIN